MSFKAPKPIKNCPVSRKSTGIVLMTPTLIGELAAAVTDKDEWAILLHGEIRDSGYEVNVTHWSIPAQDRSSGHVTVKEFDLSDHPIVDGIIQDNPYNDVVGVIHSHHSMGAFFSTTDTSTLNPRFPVSIVVAHGEGTYLGFKYLGTGKVKLPCSSTAEIEFKIQATEGPVVEQVSKVTHNEADLGDCNRYEDKAADSYHVHFQGACGISEPQHLRALAFGTEATLKDAVAALPRPSFSYVKGGGVGKTYSGGHQPLTQQQIQDDEDSRWCKQHKKWDFCEYSDLIRKSSNVVWCATHKVLDNCFIKTALICPKCQANTTRPSSQPEHKGDHYCFKCDTYFPTASGKKGGETSNGWLGKYEELVARGKTPEEAAAAVNAEAEKEDAVAGVSGEVDEAEHSLMCPCDRCALADAEDKQKDEQDDVLQNDLYLCIDCSKYNPSMNWECAGCGAPWCMICEEGHRGPCIEEKDGKCRCGDPLPSVNDLYCSVSCYAYYEPTGDNVVIKVEGGTIKGKDLGDGCIKIH